MKDKTDLDFARRFVTAYWQDVVDHPGLEPVEQTLAELLAEVSWQIERTRNELVITMRNKDGDTWHFSFEKSRSTWTIKKFRDAHHDDLLSPPYDGYFIPMLRRVLHSASDPKQ